MRIIVTTLVGFLLAWLLSLVLPWYVLALAMALVHFFLPTGKVGAVVLAGAMSGFLLWGVLSAWMSSANGGLLADRVGAMLGGLSGSALVLATGLLGAVYAALGALFGYQCRQAVLRGREI